VFQAWKDAFGGVGMTEASRGVAWKRGKNLRKVEKKWMGIEN
jgi:hypothetical protein